MEPMGERGRQGAAPLGGTDIETLRAGVVVMHDGTGRLETVYPDLYALSRIERVVEAAGALGAMNVDRRELVEEVLSYDEKAAFMALREALGALDG